MPGKQSRGAAPHGPSDPDPAIRPSGNARPKGPHFEGSVGPEVPPLRIFLLVRTPSAAGSRGRFLARRALLASAWLILWAVPRTALALDVPLTITNREGAALVAEPVVSGIPFAQGSLADAGSVRLLRAGTEVPAQFSAPARWPDGSVRWLHVATEVEVPASGEANRDDVQRRARASPLERPVRPRVAYRAIASRRPSSTASMVAGRRRPARDRRERRSRVNNWETFTTDGRGSPDSFVPTGTFPGASQSARLPVMMTVMTVWRRLRLKALD